MASYATLPDLIEPRPTLPDTSDYVRRADVECSTLPAPVVPAVQQLPVQEPGTRVSRALPYELLVAEATDGGDLVLTISNAGEMGAALTVFDELRLATTPPRQYAVTSGSSVVDQFPATCNCSNASTAGHALTLLGPNGLLRQYAGRGLPPASVGFAHAAANLQVVLTLKNTGTAALQFTITDNAYGALPTPLTVKLAAGTACLCACVPACLPVCLPTCLPTCVHVCHPHLRRCPCSSE